MSDTTLVIEPGTILDKTITAVKQHWLIGLILLTAAIVRLWGLDFGLPYAYHVDEPRYIYSAVGILQTGNLNPNWFQQPSLYTYLVTAVLGIYYLMGFITGQFQSTADLFQPTYHFDGYIPLPAEFLLPRLLTAVIGVATVLLAYWIGKRWMGQAGALAAAAFLALSFFHSESSHYIATDVPLAFFILATLYFSYRISETGQHKYYLLAGVMAGMAIGTKYSAYVLAIPTLLAHLLAWRQGKTRLLSPRVLLLGLYTVFVFLITTPFAIFDNQQFIADVRYEFEHHQVVGHVGAEGNSGLWLLTQLLTRSDRWLTLLSVAGFGLAIWKRKWSLVIVLAFTLAYFLSMASNIVRFERFLVPMIPALALAAGYTFSFIHKQIPDKRQPVLLILGLLLLIEPVLWVGRFDNRLAQTEVRTLARQWILDNIPADSYIARERYSPNLENEGYSAQLFDQLYDNPPEWYIDQGFDYIIFAEARYRTIYLDPDRYPAEIQAYERLFDNLELVQSFNGPYVGRPDHEIRIYRPPS